MTNDKMIQLVKRWRDIERQQKDIDFARSQLARDIRWEFQKGDRGDEQFANWCAHELGLTAFAAKELLLRAVAVTVVPDERTWKMVGGFKAIRPLQDLTRPQQVEVLEAAKSQSKAPRTIMKERGLGWYGTPTPEPPRPAAPARSIWKEKEDPHKTAYVDAVALAQYINKSDKRAPKDIQAIVNRYLSFMRKAA